MKGYAPSARRRRAKLFAAKRYSDDVIAGRIATDAGPPCPVCRTASCRIKHDRQGYSWAECRLCGANNRREHAPAE